MLLAEPIEITHRIAQEFERLRIRYLVGGFSKFVTWYSQSDQ
jgi:hypothetical protein